MNDGAYSLADYLPVIGLGVIALIVIIGAVMIRVRAVKNGRKLVPVNPAYTTQTCSECGEIANPPIGLKVRTYRCRHCGMAKDRDKNAALNMLIRAGLVPEAHGDRKTPSGCYPGDARPIKA